jgi:hypothetical protein
MGQTLPAPAIQAFSPMPANLFGFQVAQPAVEVVEVLVVDLV